MINLIPPNSQEKIISLNPIDKNIIKRRIDLYLKNKTIIEEKVKKYNDFDSLLQIYKSFLILLNKSESNSPESFSEFIKKEVQLDSYLHQLRSILFNGIDPSLNDHVTLNKFKREFYSKNSNPERLKLKIEFFQDKLQELTDEIDALIIKILPFDLDEDTKMLFYEILSNLNSLVREGFSTIIPFAKVASLLFFLLFLFGASANEVLALDNPDVSADTHLTEGLHFDLEQTPTEVPDSTALTEEEIESIRQNIHFLEYSESNQVIIDSILNELFSSETNSVRIALAEFYSSTQEKDRIIELYNALLPEGYLTDDFSLKLGFINQLFGSIFKSSLNASIDIRDLFPILYFEDSFLNDLAFEKYTEVQSQINLFLVGNQIGTFISSNNLYFCPRGVGAACVSSLRTHQEGDFPVYTLNSFVFFNHESWHFYERGMKFEVGLDGVMYDIRGLREFAASVMNDAIYRSFMLTNTTLLTAYNPSTEIISKLVDVISLDPNKIQDLYLIATDQTKTILDFVDETLRDAPAEILSQLESYISNFFINEDISIINNLNLSLKDKLLFAYSIKIEDSVSLTGSSLIEHIKFLNIKGLMSNYFRTFSNDQIDSSLDDLDLENTLGLAFMDYVEIAQQEDNNFKFELFSVLTFFKFNSKLVYNIEINNQNDMLMLNSLYFFLINFTFSNEHTRQSLLNLLFNYESSTPAAVSRSLGIEVDSFTQLSEAQRFLVLENVLNEFLSYTNLSQEEKDLFIQNCISKISFTSSQSNATVVDSNHIDWVRESFAEILGRSDLNSEIQLQQFELFVQDENVTAFFITKDTHITFVVLEKDQNGAYQLRTFDMDRIVDIYIDLLLKGILVNFKRNGVEDRSYSLDASNSYLVWDFWNQVNPVRIVSLIQFNELNFNLDIDKNPKKFSIMLDFITRYSQSISSTAVSEQQVRSDNPDVNRILGSYNPWFGIGNPISRNIEVRSIDWAIPILNQGMSYENFVGELSENPGQLSELFNKYFTIELGGG